MVEFMQKGGLLGRSVQFVRKLLSMKVGLFASSACYFMVLSFFPLLVLMLGFLRHTGLEVENLLAFLEGFVPGALMEGARQLVFETYLGTTGTLLGLSALTALWSASRSAEGLKCGLRSSGVPGLCVYPDHERVLYLRFFAGASIKSGAAGLWQGPFGGDALWGRAADRLFVRCCGFSAAFLAADPDRPV